MKNHLIPIAVLAALFLGGSLQAQEKKAEAEKAAPTTEELEAKFKALLTKATLSGRWSPVDNAELGAEKKEDKYEIVSASKVSGDNWIVQAKMRYGKNEMVIPIPVQVKWSGETPMIIVNNLSMGGGRSYSARVLFYQGMYSGAWEGSSGYGGVIYGTVDHATAETKKPEEKKPDQK